MRNESCIGWDVADQIYWPGFRVIKKGHRAKREMLRLGNGTIHGPITHHSAREKEEDGEEGLQQAQGDERVERWWGQAGLRKRGEEKEKTEGRFHVAVAGEKQSLQLAWHVLLSPNNKWEKVKHWLCVTGRMFYIITHSVSTWKWTETVCFNHKKHWQFMHFNGF